MMLLRFRPAAFAAGTVLCLAGALTTKLTLAQPASAHMQAPDNSAQNKSQGATADTQTNANVDRQTTAKIRKAIVGEKDLSTYAHNVKIITVNGEVTLKGPVQSEEEKQRVISIASNVVPSAKIVNQLTVNK